MNYKEPGFIVSLLSGGAAGTAVDVALYPLDTIKTRLQSKAGFWKSGGFRAIYSGVGPAALGSAPNAAVFFCTYEFVKKFGLQFVSFEWSVLIHMTAASAGEVAACVVRVPVEVVKQRRQTTAQHLSAFTVACQAVANEGLFKGLYRGFFSTLVREIPFSVIQFSLWEELKDRWAKANNLEQADPFATSLCGATAGGFAAAVTTPLDVAKTRIMLADSFENQSIISVLKQVYSEHGIPGMQGRRIILGIVVITIFQNEWFSYWLKSQSWPKVTCPSDDEYCIRILIVADPQILGDNLEIGFPIGALARWDSDKYLAKTFHLVKNHVQPHVVIFLGDLMNEGSLSTATEYARYFARFTRIFYPEQGVQMIYLPGDNDIGGESDPVTLEKVGKFQDMFGQSDVIHFRGLCFVKVNRLQYIIPKLEAESFNETRIILSHLPLLSYPSPFMDNAMSTVMPHLILSAHEHVAKHTTGAKDGRRGVTLPLLSILKLQLRERYTIHELLIPTCSYRMGEPDMGYGALAIAIIMSVSLMTVYCSRMWWPPESSLGGFLHMCLFLALSALTIFNFLSAIYVGPGFLPLGWKPDTEEEAYYLQYCKICGGYKAPRSHHCRKCRRCVTKMDHHCPWINNCVGHRNHGHFTAFLFFAVCGCIQAALALGCSLYHALHRITYLYYGNGTEPIIVLSLTGLVACVFCLGLAIGVVLAVGMLLYFQVRSILRNRTVIEDWIVEKAKYRRLHSDENEGSFVFPYNLGYYNNIKQVINLTCEPVGDGLSWPIAEGCDPFDLTREQLLQKEEKRQRARKYEIVRDYSGAWLPLVHGFKTLVCVPCSDEPRIKLKEGDTVSVTRWKKHWLFGELSSDSKREGWRVRGWFPRNIAVDLTESVGKCMLNASEDRKKQ